MKSLKSVYEEFRRDAEWNLTVRLRRKRAEQLRELLGDPKAIDLDTFNHEVWVHDSGSIVHGDSGEKTKLSDASLEEKDAALEDGRIEIHGNHIWGSGSRVYAAALNNIPDKDKLENVRRALHLLGESSLPALKKAWQIKEIPGFGHNISTGLVMIFHPESFAIYNKQSIGAAGKLDRDASTLQTFQDTVRQLSEELDAQDFLELDWFLYLVNNGLIEIPEPRKGRDAVMSRGLNTILYGPPGTGKTYSVQRRALEVLGAYPEEGLSPEQVSEAFRDYRSRGQVEFVTFHPSYSYEEFVEGFRYDPDEQIPTLHKGLFQTFADNAANPRQDLAPAEGAKIWKVSLGPIQEQWVFDRCMANNEIAVGWLEGVDLGDADKQSLSDLFKKHHPDSSIKSVDNLVNGMSPGDYVAVFASSTTIRAIGVLTGDYVFKGDQYDHYQHTRPVEWLDNGEHVIAEINGNTKLAF